MEANGQSGWPFYYSTTARLCRAAQRVDVVETCRDRSNIHHDKRTPSTASMAPQSGVCMPAECSADGGQESKRDSPAALLENADETLSRGARIEEAPGNRLHSPV